MRATAASLTTNISKGSYSVWVDGCDGSWGAFDLVVTLTDPHPANDRCDDVPSLFAATTVKGTTANATDDYGSGPFSSECGGEPKLPGPDVVYSYTTSWDGAVGGLRRLCWDGRGVRVPRSSRRARQPGLARVRGLCRRPQLHRR